MNRCWYCKQPATITFSDGCAKVSCSCPEPSNTSLKEEPQELNAITIRAKGDMVRIDCPLDGKELVEELFVSKSTGIIKRLMDSGYDISTLRLYVEKL